MTTRRSTKPHILVVDDEASNRDSLSMLFLAKGYGVSTAGDGFDALLQLRTTVPDLIICDLIMPSMSGFEFLSVIRRRFPSIPVIAISACACGGAVPGGILADGFYAKGHHHPEELLATVADLLKTSAARAVAHQKQSAPVWVPRSGKDSRGMPFIMLTCSECLRSFPLSVFEETLPEMLETRCLFCPNTIRYIVDFSLPVASPGKRRPAGDHPVGGGIGVGCSALVGGSSSRVPHGSGPTAVSPRHLGGSRGTQRLPVFGSSAAPGRYAKIPIGLPPGR